MKDPSPPPEVPVDRLHWRCPADCLAFGSTADLPEQVGIIGQERALRAMQFGLAMEGYGYNLYLNGPAGTGRRTAMEDLLKDYARRRPIPEDLCYVFNFKNPDTPTSLRFPPGQGKAFKRALKGAVQELIQSIPALFESRSYRERKVQLQERYRKRSLALLTPFERQARRAGFALVQLQEGEESMMELLPLVKGKAVSMEEYENLVEAGKVTSQQLEAMRKEYLRLSGLLQDLTVASRKIDRELEARLDALQRATVRPLISEIVARLKINFPYPRVPSYLASLARDIRDQLPLFREHAAAEPGAADPYWKYQVNVAVDNSDLEAAPVIVEITPSFRNLFGTIEQIMEREGVYRSDYMKIKAGSLLRANGGFLVLYALDVLAETNVWPTLKRALRTQKAEIQSPEPVYMFSYTALKPEPVPIDLKVILIGDEETYGLLYEHDEDFRKTFKVRADFSPWMGNTAEGIAQYAGFIKRVTEEEGLRPFDRSAVQAVVEYGVRHAERQNRLSTEFHKIADLAREADYWARQEGRTIVREAHVTRATREKGERERLLQDILHREILDGTLLIDTTGQRVGQVNGLSIIGMGDYSFGLPMRITARVALGGAGVINIEREAHLSGKTHDKGLLILSGYLRGQYTRDKPLAISASLCFEQSYSEVEGDSASAAELYALLSSLAEVPLRQDLAVTGSVNQHGEIQPIGGINEKIEGFFDACAARRLTGKQGVVLPARNIGNLMLREDVVRAVTSGRFHLYPVAHIDEGLPILTGLPAGRMRRDGSYPPDTLHGRVDQRLLEFARQLQQFSRPLN